jgi:hypothetical protein
MKKLPGPFFGIYFFSIQTQLQGRCRSRLKKLIMYEGMNKYAIRGSTMLEYTGSKVGGDKKIDASFAKAPKPLLDFVNSQWDKLGTTKY